jgi:hypothetical protein
VALLARFGCGCKQRVEIPAPPTVRCAEHGSLAQLITTPAGQVRYVAMPPEYEPSDEGESGESSKNESSQKTSRPH